MSNLTRSWCTYCLKGFGAPGSLRNHVNIDHKKEVAAAKAAGEFKCPNTGCSNGFSRKFNLDRHLQNCSAPPPVDPLDLLDPPKTSCEVEIQTTLEMCGDWDTEFSFTPTES
jgi:uncharacterized Zn-finger protein